MNTVETVKQHLENDDHGAALEVFKSLRKDEINDTCYSVFGVRILNKTRREMLRLIGLNLPRFTRTSLAEQEAAESRSLAYADAVKAIENAEAHWAGHLGPPLGVDWLSDLDFYSPHGRGRPAVAEAWRVTVRRAILGADPADREILLKLAENTLARS